MYVTFVACLVFQGTNASALEKDIGPEQFPINEHYFGLVNVSSAASSHALTAFIDRTLNSGVIYQNKRPRVSVSRPSTRTAQPGCSGCLHKCQAGIFPVCFSRTCVKGSVPQHLHPCPRASVSQFGNTCYCNSVLQALYFCRPFRENVLAYKAQQKKKENLLTCLADLFHSIATQKKKVGVIPPKKFISRLRKENGEKPVLFEIRGWKGNFTRADCSGAF